MGIRKLLLLMLALCSSVAWASSINLRQGVTDISNEVYQLHMIIFWVCVAIALVVFGIMFWAIFHHRQDQGAKPANFHESTKVEIIWTAIPVVILIAMAIPATQVLVKMEDTSKADLTIKVTGSQWKWHYEYLGEDVSFYSNLSTPSEQIKNESRKSDEYLLEVDQPLVIPAVRKVRFLITSDDVIHSWWVPDFAVKKDAVPGYINEAWTKVNRVGIYRGQCAELCGKDHGFMPVVVEAKSPEKFAKWLADTKLAQQQAKEQQAKLAAMNLSLNELMALGEQTYVAKCAACHQVNGQGINGVFPALAGSDIATQYIPAHIDIVVNGKAGTSMQAFAQQLSLTELAAVITYERNAWGNDTGDVVQAKDIQAFIDAVAEGSI